MRTGQSANRIPGPEIGEGERGTVVLLPVKGLESAKLRLAGLLSPAERGRLALAMLRDVIVAVDAAGLMPCVLSPDLDVLAFAHQAGADATRQASGARSLNRALVSALEGAGAERALVILPDTPLIASDEIRELLGGLCLEPGRRDSQARVSIATDRRGTGTNAIVLQPPSAIPLHFGVGSLARHTRAAADRGVQIHIHRLPGLALDIDRPEDVAEFLRVDEPTHTRQVLEEWGVAERLAAYGGTP